MDASKALDDLILKQTELFATWAKSAKIGTAHTLIRLNQKN